MEDDAGEPVSVSWDEAVANLSQAFPGASSEEWEHDPAKGTYRSLTTGQTAKEKP